MKYFDFESALIRRLETAANDPERWAARTTVGKEEFGPAAERAGFRLLVTADRLTVPKWGACLVVGVATWSDPDVAVLDSAVDRIRTRQISTWVFDIDESRTVADLEAFMPEVRMRPTNTPIFAYYVDQQLQTFGQGQDTVHWLEQL